MFRPDAASLLSNAEKDGDAITRKEHTSCSARRLIDLHLLSSTSTISHPVSGLHSRLACNVLCPPQPASTPVASDTPVNTTIESKQHYPTNMVKFYSTNYTYDHPFPTVSLAYFLRYPNPYSRHVASTDTISRHYDPETQRLTTVRLHLKRSRMPAGVLRLLPKGSTQSPDKDGSTQSFILEKSVVDVNEGWMETESRNLDWKNVLSVIERQTYTRPSVPGAELDAGVPEKEPEQTHVAVTVTLKSRIGEQLRKRRARWGEQANASSVTGGEVEEAPVKQGWFSNWSSGAVRSAIEAISLQRTERSQPKAQMGMGVVLQRLREGGLEKVFEGMQKDREIDI